MVDPACEVLPPGYRLFGVTAPDGSMFDIMAKDVAQAHSICENAGLRLDGQALMRTFYHTEGAYHWRTVDLGGGCVLCKRCPACGELAKPCAGTPTAAPSRSATPAAAAS